MLFSQTKDEINRIFEDVIQSGYAHNAELYAQAGRNVISYEENKELQQLVKAVKAQTKAECKNITGSMGFAVKQANGTIKFTKLADYYQSTLDKGLMQIASGAFDYNTVLCRVIKEMTNSGLRTVTYASGHSDRVTVAARRALITGFNQVVAQVNEDNAKQLGTDYFEVSYHSGARPTHQIWQGRVYSKAQLESVCGLGTVTGLCGANCYHSYSPFVPGVDIRTYTDEQLDKMNAEENTPVEYGGKQYTKYEATQRQRALERAMRANRQEIALLEAGGADEDAITAANARYRKNQDEYVKFSNAMNLPQQWDRVTAGGARDLKITKAKTNMRAVDLGEKSVAKSKKSDIIKEQERMTHSADFAVPKSLTESRKFISKFSSMSDNAEQSRQFYQEAKAMLHRRSGTNGEDLLYYNQKLNKWYRSTEGTEKGSPDYNAEILQGLKEANKNEIIAFHNHPLGMPPSDGDLNAALRNGYKKGYTIGHDGTVFEYTAPTKKIPAASYMMYVEAFKKQGLSEFEAQLSALKSMQRLYGFNFKEVK